MLSSVSIYDAFRLCVKGWPCIARSPAGKHASGCCIAISPAGKHATTRIVTVRLCQNAPQQKNNCWLLPSGNGGDHGELVFVAGLLLFPGSLMHLVFFATGCPHLRSALVVCVRRHAPPLEVLLATPFLPPFCFSRCLCVLQRRCRCLRVLLPRRCRLSFPRTPSEYNGTDRKATQTATNRPETPQELFTGVSTCGRHLSTVSCAGVFHTRKTYCKPIFNLERDVKDGPTGERRFLRYSTKSRVGNYSRSFYS
jgi:hypothetical protein